MFPLGNSQSKLGISHDEESAALERLSSSGVFTDGVKTPISLRRNSNAVSIMRNSSAPMHWGPISQAIIAKLANQSSAR